MVGVIRGCTLGLRCFTLSFKIGGGGGVNLKNKFWAGGYHRGFNLLEIPTILPAVMLSMISFSVCKTILLILFTFKWASPRFRLLRTALGLIGFPGGAHFPETVCKKKQKKL